MTNNQSKIIVLPQNNKSRLDTFLASEIVSLSRSGIKKLITDGLVTVNGEMVKAGYTLKTGDEVVYTIPPPQEVDLTPEDIELEIVYQDSDLAVINKPQGLTVHPAAGHFSHTLVNALLYHLDDLSGINGELRPGIVHRLDKDTSGLMLVAKNDRAHRHLAEQIAQKTCIRRYYALVEGMVKERSGHIETYIARDKANRKRMAVSQNPADRKAISDWKLIQNYENFSLLEFQLHTGRTHQIRVHCAYMHHPIVGDMLYGYKHQSLSTSGQLLHSHYIEFTQPTTQKRLSFEVGLPKYFADALSKIKVKK